MPALTIFSLLSIGILCVVYFFLITEKLNKVLVAGLGALILILFQVFRSFDSSSQTNAFTFISHNLDVLGFVIGMMILVGIVRESGLFEAIAIWLVKQVKGQPFLLIVALGYLTLIMTTFFSNIPTILIMAPVVIVLIKQLKLPFLPFFFIVVTMANIGGAMTPISDPTTYYEAKTVGLSFMEVVSNSGLIVLILSVVAIFYTKIVFRKQLAAVKINPTDVALFTPKAAIRNKRVLYRGTPLLILAVLTMILKEPIYALTGITLDNATITLTAAFLAMLIFHREPKKVFTKLIDWEIIFFFMGLFIVVGALEYTKVIEGIALVLVRVSGGSPVIMTLLMSVGSAFISTFIDNVPYNITMVGAIQAIEKTGIYVYPLWWALNLGTSVGGAGSPIAAACNVVLFGAADKEGFKTNFVGYLKVGLPFALISSIIAFGVLWLRYLR